MPNQKISELTTIVTVDNAVDLFPIVDTSANTTKKITPTALKSALALDNVNNTSDANKPVSTAQQDALNAKVTANAAIVAATKTKITYDAKGLVTAGDILDAADMPTGINAANIGTGVVSSTEFGYLDGVTSAIQTQLNAKQATLVSGTNIKTINGATVLGTGDITIAGNPPSGVSGAIQFSNGSAFASDAANLFWDDTNNRLGIGTNAPSVKYDQQGGGALFNMGGGGTNSFRVQRGGSTLLNVGTDNASIYLSADGGNNGNIQFTKLNGSLLMQISDIGTVATIKGVGSTSATTSLLVQNSAGTSAVQVKDDLSTIFSGTMQVNANLTANGLFSGGNLVAGTNCYGPAFYINSGGNAAFGAVVNAAASAVVECISTTKGFLPPRMTTTQKNAIASPAAGLVVYDSTLAKLCVYTTTWETITSL